MIDGLGRSLDDGLTNQLGQVCIGRLCTLTTVWLHNAGSVLSVDRYRILSTCSKSLFFHPLRERMNRLSDRYEEAYRIVVEQDYV